jgi:hypothetical protein
VAFEVGYVGTKGTHVFAGTGGDYGVNQATIDGFGTLTANQRKPFFRSSDGRRIFDTMAATPVTTITLFR